MELIATAKSKQAQDRIQRSLPYFEALAEVAGQARKASGDDAGPAHALLEKREVKKVAILAVVANRGLAGGYTLADRALAALHTPVRYRPVETDGAARAARRIAEVLDNRGRGG
jgi:hypothetical protein